MLVLHASHFGHVTAGTAARLFGHTQVARIDELDVLGIFLQPLGVSANRIGRVPGILRNARLGVRLLSKRDVLRRVRLHAGGADDLRIAAVAIGAADPHRARSMHGRAVGGSVTAVAAVGLLVHLLLRLLQQNVRRALLIGSLTAPDMWRDGPPARFAHRELKSATVAQTKSHHGYDSCAARLEERVASSIQFRTSVPRVAKPDNRTLLL